MGTFSVLHKLQINSSAENIFRMVSEPHFLDKWWTKSSEGKQKINGKYIFHFSEDFIWKAEIVQYNPPLEIQYLMIDSDADWDGTILQFIISPKENFTELELRHSGWKYDNEHFYQTEKCWKNYLEIMKIFLEKNISIPYENRN